MFQTAIFLFLIGAVLAWRFRVWILLPISLIATITTAVISIEADMTFAIGLAFSLLLGAAPQMGYAFGLFVRYCAVMARSPQPASVAVLYKQRATDRAR